MLTCQGVFIEDIICLGAPNLYEFLFSNIIMMGLSQIEKIYISLYLQDFLENMAEKIEQFKSFLAK